MSEIKFRYNKYSETMLYFMVISGVILGFLIYTIIIYYSGIIKGPEYLPLYLKKYKKYVIYLIFGLIPICMLVPTYLVAKYWGSKEEEGSIKLYDDFAILYWDGQEIKINKGELSIKFMSPRLQWYVLYIIKTQKRKIKLCSSVIEWKEDKGNRFALSLDIAMDKLMYYEKGAKMKELEETLVHFYELEILIGISTPEIFENTQYYVDYDSVVTIPEGRFATCLIRERGNLIHVVGDLGIDISLLRIDQLNEENLKKQVITGVIELDEQVDLYN
ncbi:MAG: hypothetical protein Q4A58_00240 [Fusobacterium sp.]|uniref:hypothetical protein n=1 Tax=Fusobacterium sp. TaxID=68766 RepID=UPI0026DB83D1|nr:hypothetical protein [Fusobacterium sp.]MDO4689716.1 hypothetical protein [Fusobacterium sp.]